MYQNPDVESYRSVYKWVDSEGVGGSGNFWGALRNFTGPLSRSIIYILESLAQLQSTGTLVGWLDSRGGSGCLGIEMHGMSLSRPRGCVQANYQQLIPNLQFTHCIMHKSHDWCKKVLWQRFWLELCTKQVVSARACANQFLPCSSLGICIIWHENSAGR